MHTILAWAVVQVMSRSCRCSCGSLVAEMRTGHGVLSAHGSYDARTAGMARTNSVSGRTCPLTE